MKVIKDTQIMSKLLKVAKKDGVHPLHLKAYGIDYSSAYRVFHGKATRPSLAMTMAMASATGHKLTLTKTRKPKLRTISERAK